MAGIPDPDRPRGSIRPDEPASTELIEPIRDLSARRQALYVAMLVPLVAAVAFASFTTGGWGPALGGIVAVGALVALIAWVVSRSGILARRGADEGRRAGRGGLHTEAKRPAREASRPDGAGGRLTTFLDRLDRLSIDELRLLAVRPLDPAGHEVARARALEATRFGGRVALVEEASTRIDDWIGRSFGTRSFDPELVALAWRHEPLRLDDRERLLATLSDAALAVAAEDLVDDATYGELVGPCTMLVDDGAPG